MVWKRKRKKRLVAELHPDEILLDVNNLPEFDRQQFEGRMEKPIGKSSFNALFGVMIVVALFFVGRLAILQITRSGFYEKKSEQNSLDHIAVFADRGVIYDRNGVELAWNAPGNDVVPTFRDYITHPGFATLLGYVSYPAKDSKGHFWQTRTMGKDGIEKQFDTDLAGQNGTQLIETDVNGTTISTSTIEDPVEGKNISLSIDSKVQQTLYDGIQALAQQSGYVGGAGAVMNIKTGELIAMTSYPEYDENILSAGKDKATITGYIQSPARPFLDRVTDGLYTPGSIVKPFLAIAALQEGIITPDTVLHTNGVLRVPNPYAPGQYTIFKDNANHGDVDMYKALAVSSDVYFYEIGGGFGGQQGLGIANIDKYAEMFGLGQKTGINFSGELNGTVPSIAWKAKNFPADPTWRIGDTYHTAIGQYGFQVTPIQMLRAISGIASRGTLVTPSILKSVDGKPIGKIEQLPFNDSEYNAIFTGMHMDTETGGTAANLQNPAFGVGAKTGTAQIKGNTRVNSWVEGFFPLDHPQYAFIVLMEDGPLISTGASHAMQPVISLYGSDPSLLTE
ncbi:MAG TPA: penicillin-binding transpeptidase domain-containing protein [Candidatus Paceibacterota bacterium]|jgi:penicillin-binding protein 2|nr:penicillin-binding transpeptidase domain-containing protein [Candidatus Paceibacterota bacterium]